MLSKIRSNYILKQLLEMIRYKRKLNIIKYNKRIKIKLNIKKEDFKVYIALKKFNNKYRFY